MNRSRNTRRQLRQRLTEKLSSHSLRLPRLQVEPGTQSLVARAGVAISIG